MNRVHRVIISDTTITFVLSTSGKSGFWWWEVSERYWTKYWKKQNCDFSFIKFANDFDNAEVGTSCGDFGSIKEAILDYIND